MLNTDIKDAHRLFLHKPIAKRATQELRSVFGKQLCLRTYSDPASASCFLNDQIDRLVILAMTPRSGSTLLSFTLNQLDYIKGKGEWLRWKNEGLRKRSTKLRAHNPLDLITDKWQQLDVNDDELLALKIDFGQFGPLLFIPALRERLHHAKWIFLTREDLLTQAISKYRADLTGYHHSDRPPNQSGDQEIVAPAVNFDRDEIETVLRAICQQMTSWEYLFASLNVKPLRLTYEQLTNSFSSTIEKTANHLGLVLKSRPDINDAGLRKVGDDLNTSLATRFQNEAMTSSVPKNRS